MDKPHGSSSPFVFAGILGAILVNAALAGGILIASQAQGAQIAHDRANLEAAEPPKELKDISCSWREGEARQAIKVRATDTFDAEKRVCGVAHAGAIIPPLIARGYASFVPPEGDPILNSQRESCSCTEGPEVIREVELVVAPKLGQKREEKKLPRIANPEEEVKVIQVDPDKVAVEPKPKPKPPEEEKKIVHKKPEKKPSVNPLLNPNRDRPTNDDEQEGREDGSRSGVGQGKGDPYLQSINAQFDRSMRMPASIRGAERDTLKARVSIVVSPTGVIIRKTISKSGNAVFDRMVEDTLNNFGISGRRRLRPPPAKWQNKTIRFTVDGRGVNRVR